MNAPTSTPGTTVIVTGKDPTIAALLEFGLGFFLQVFGIGHIYAGRIGTGVILLLSYWVIQFVNVMLMFVLVGFVTAPLTWLLFLIFSSIGAANAARDANAVIAARVR